MEFYRPQHKDTIISRTIKRRRFIKTLERLPENLGRTLEVDRPNPFTPLLRWRTTSLAHLNFDLNYCPEPSIEYTSILCFEVLEHLFDPLQFLRYCRGSLKKNGRIYLTTPRPRPLWLKIPQHYHEIPEIDLRNLLKEAKFEITKYEGLDHVPMWVGFTGIRPFMRRMFTQCQFVVAR